MVSLFFFFLMQYKLRQIRNKSKDELEGSGCMAPKRMLRYATEADLLEGGVYTGTLPTAVSSHVVWENVHASGKG